MSLDLDLTPFGFTATESRVYGVLLQTGPASGYAVARAARLARANTYGALDGLVTRGAAVRVPGRPARYRPTDPDALLTQVATSQGQALERLGQALAQAGRTTEPEIRVIEGTRGTANVILQTVARAGQSVHGLISAELLRATLPAWRRAAEKTQVSLVVPGEGEIPDEATRYTTRTGPHDLATLLLVDDRQVIAAIAAASGLSGLWTSHHALIAVARHALEGIH